MSGHDFWRGVEPQYHLRGRYVTDLLTEESIRLIKATAKHRDAPPLFLFISHLAPHSGNSIKYHEYPEEDLERFNYIPDLKRRKYAGIGHTKSYWFNINLNKLPFLQQWFGISISL
jgi:arylsulfatase B